MEIKNEHIVVILLVILVGYLIMRQTSENFNVLEDRWAYPLTNEAGNSWTQEFARPVYYSYPDGKLSYIPENPTKIPKSVYKEQIYGGDFEIPEFNYEDMPVPRKEKMFDVDETQSDFMRGVSCNRMPESDAQQHYVHLKRQMQAVEQSNIMPHDHGTETFHDSLYDQQYELEEPQQFPAKTQMPQTQMQLPHMQQVQMPPQQMPMQPQMQPMMPRKYMMRHKRRHSNFHTILLIVIIAALAYYLYSKRY